MDLTTATPVEIDTALADIWNRWYAKDAEIDRQVGYQKDYRKTLAQVDAGTYRYSWMDEYDRPRVEKAIATLDEKIAALSAEAREIMREAKPLNEEFSRRGGWTRFYAVQGGHIHSSMDCSTCNKMGKATRFGWLPERSGQSEAEALESLVTESSKTVLCTVCYPSAPVAWTVPREDESTCKGSGTWDYDPKTARLGYYTGNYGVCNQCKKRTTVSSTGKMRKHKKA